MITLNRPAVRNAVDGDTANAVAAALDLLDGDDGLSVGVLTGTGGTFSAGMDSRRSWLGSGPRCRGAAWPA